MLPDIVESPFERADGHVASSTLTVRLQKLFQHCCVLPNQTLRHAQLILDAFTAHWKSFVKKCKNWGENVEYLPTAVLLHWIINITVDEPHALELRSYLTVNS